MDTIQLLHVIRKLVKLRRIFTGVFPIDKIKHIRKQGQWACIINTAPSTHRGEHWVAMIKINTYPEYFDSYGLPPPHAIHKLLTSHFNRYKFNKTQVQGPFAITCGAHCIYFLHKRTEGETMQRITQKLDDNEARTFIQKFYSPDEDSDEETPYSYQRANNLFYPTRK